MLSPCCKPLPSAGGAAATAAPPPARSSRLLRSVARTPASYSAAALPYSPFTHWAYWLSSPSSSDDTTTRRRLRGPPVVAACPRGCRHPATVNGPTVLSSLSLPAPLPFTSSLPGLAPWSDVAAAVPGVCGDSHTALASLPPPPNRQPAIGGPGGMANSPVTAILKTPTALASVSLAASPPSGDRGSDATLPYSSYSCSLPPSRPPYACPYSPPPYSTAPPSSTPASCSSPPASPTSPPAAPPASRSDRSASSSCSSPYKSYNSPPSFPSPPLPQPTLAAAGPVPASVGCSPNPPLAPPPPCRRRGTRASPCRQSPGAAPAAPEDFAAACASPP